MTLCRDLKQAFKVEHIETGLAGEKELSFYRQGEFVDLCRGIHVPSAGRDRRVQAVERGRRVLERGRLQTAVAALYGTAWFSKDDLESHLKLVEEAKRRDHRVLGKHLELFTTSPMVGSGLILWLPKGATIRGLLESFVRDE